MIVGEIYKHHKGNFYKIIALAKDADTLAEIVVYQNTKTAEIWTRPKSEFEGVVKKDATFASRFELVIKNQFVQKPLQITTETLKKECFTELQKFYSKPEMYEYANTFHQQLYFK